MQSSALPPSPALCVVLSSYGDPGLGRAFGNCSKLVLAESAGFVKISLPSSVFCVTGAVKRAS